MNFGSEDNLPVYGFSETYIMMVASMKNCLTNDDDDDDADFKNIFRGNMTAEIKQTLCNKNFSLQDQGKCDENATLQKRIKFWANVKDMVSNT